MIYSGSHEVVCYEAMQLFNSCSNEIQNEILESIHVNYLNEGNVFLNKGDMVEGLYVIHSGCIKIFNPTREKDQIFSFLGKGDIIGLNTLFESHRVDFSAIVHSHSIVCFIPANGIRNAIKQSPSVFLSLMKYINEKAESIEERSTMIMTDSAERIVINTLSTLTNKFGKDEQGYLKLYMPVRDLANYMCMSKTNLYRILNNLKEKLILDYEDERFKLMRGF